MADYYDVLEIPRTANAEEIKKAYRQLVKSHHPDIDYSARTARQRGKATERMMKINEAYERTIKGDVRYRFVIDIASLK